MQFKWEYVNISFDRLPVGYMSVIVYLCDIEHILKTIVK